MKVLTFTTLYPDATRVRHGIFVETRLRQLQVFSGIECRVVAPVPWFPSKNALFGDYAAYAGVPRRENRQGVAVYHPRYPLLPRLGMLIAPLTMALAVAPLLRKLLREGYDFDVIDAHYFYPDGVAAALLAQIFNKPLVITARGSDLNLIARYALPRKWMRWAAHRADHLIAVSEELKQVLLGMEVPAEKITVLRNGVDATLFRPVERDKLRRRLAMRGFVLLSVGNLVPAKGHDLVIELVARIADAQLFIIGQGRCESELRSLIAERGLEARVQILDNMDQELLRDYYGAADALVLASAREGWPNVLLESMACGTPVIATPVGASPGIVAVPQAGVLAQERSVDALFAAIQRLRAHYPDRAATRAYAGQFGWDEISAGQMRIFNRIVQARAA